MDLKTCLIVDDSRIIRKVARRILEGLNFDVQEAADGAEALTLCSTALPQAILLDWHMPVMDGLTFLQHLRGRPDGRAVKVLVCSVENRASRIAQALDAGADDYVMKPFDGEILHSKLIEVGAC